MTSNEGRVKEKRGDFLPLLETSIKSSVKHQDKKSNEIRHKKCLPLSSTHHLSTGMLGMEESHTMQSKESEYLLANSSYFTLKVQKSFLRFLSFYWPFLTLFFVAFFAFFFISFNELSVVFSTSFVWKMVLFFYLEVDFFLIFQNRIVVKIFLFHFGHFFVLAINFW